MLHSSTRPSTKPIRSRLDLSTRSTLRTALRRTAPDMRRSAPLGGFDCAAALREIHGHLSKVLARQVFEGLLPWERVRDAVNVEVGSCGGDPGSMRWVERAE